MVYKKKRNMSCTRSSWFKSLNPQLSIIYIIDTCDLIIELDLPYAFNIVSRPIDSSSSPEKCKIKLCCPRLNSIVRLIIVVKINFNPF